MCHHSLPLDVQIIIDPPVGDCHHDDENAEEDDAHQELIDGPHWDGEALQVAGNIKRRFISVTTQLHPGWSENECGSGVRS